MRETVLEAAVPAGVDLVEYTREIRRVREMV